MARVDDLLAESRVETEKQRRMVASLAVALARQSTTTEQRKPAYWRALAERRTTMEGQTDKRLRREAL